MACDRGPGVVPAQKEFRFHFRFLLWSKNRTEFYSKKMNEFIYQTLLHMEENYFETKPRIEEDQGCRHLQVRPLCGPQLPARSLTKGQLCLICVSLPFSEEMCCEGQAAAMDIWVDLHFSGDSLCSSQQTSQAMFDAEMVCDIQKPRLSQMVHPVQN